MILIIIFYIQVGFNAGDGVHYYSAPGARTDSMKNLTTMSNINIPGKFVFRLDQVETGNGNIIYIIHYVCYWLSMELCLYIQVCWNEETTQAFHGFEKQDIFL